MILPAAQFKFHEIEWALEGGLRVPMVLWPGHRQRLERVIPHGKLLEDIGDSPVSSGIAAAMLPFRIASAANGYVGLRKEGHAKLAEVIRRSGNSIPGSQYVSAQPLEGLTFRQEDGKSPLVSVEVLGEKMFFPTVDYVEGLREKVTA